MISLGTVIDPLISPEPLRVIPQVSALEPYAHLACLRADIAERYGLDLTPAPAAESGGFADIAESPFQRHALFPGPTGSGKSRCVEIPELHFLKRGDSLVKFDPKLSSLTGVVAKAHECGIAPEDTFLFSPTVPSGVPRLPIFSGDLPVSEIVEQLVDLVEDEAGTRGPRRHDLLVNVGNLVGSSDRGFAIDEIITALQDPQFREALLNLPVKRPDPFMWRQVDRFFRGEMARWSKGETAEAVAACTRLLRELARSRHFFGLFNALEGEGRPILRLSDFWQRQRVLLIHMDAAALGQQGSSLLAGMLARRLFAAAMQQGTDRKRDVLLVMDELPQVAPLIAEELERIVSLGRSQGLKLILAAQFARQLPDRLRESVTRQCAVQVFFRTDEKEAKDIAELVAAALEPPITEVWIAPERVERESGALSMTVRRHRITDGHGRPVQINRTVWERTAGRYALTGVPAESLQSLAANAAGPGRLFVREPGSGQPVELARYLQDIRPCRSFIDGPDLVLSVVFPRVKVTRVSRASKADIVTRIAAKIQKLPPRTAVLRVDGVVRGVIRIADVPDTIFGPEHERYLADVLRINGQSDEEILATLEERARRIEELARGGSAAHPATTGAQRTGGSSDGSRW